MMWWCLDQPEDMDSAFAPVSIGGVPAVELSFSIPLVYSTDHGEPYLLCGHLDTIGKYGEEHFISDDKTTKRWLGPSYWAGWSPNIQLDIYDLAGSLLYPELGIKGVMIEANQVTPSGANFGHRVYYKTAAQRAELLDDLAYYLEQAESFARVGVWPMNRKACAMCHFNKVCSLPPERREQALHENYQRRFWNPLEER